MPADEKIQTQLAALIECPQEGGYSAYIEWAGKILTLVGMLRGVDASVTQSLQEVYSSFMKYGGRGDPKSGQVVSDTSFIHAFEGAVRALKADHEAGFLVDLRLQIRADAEADFLEQAGQFLADGLKDAAAMLTGAVLEDCLRQLCAKWNVSEEKSIGAMNASLRKAGAYNVAQQQLVTAWAATRNNAAHGQYSEYTLEDVKLMHQGVLLFVVQHL